MTLATAAITWLTIACVALFLALLRARRRLAKAAETQVIQISQERNDLEAVLDSMMEGVIAIDLHERVIKMNEAVEQMFGYGRGRGLGKMMREVIRHDELQHFVQRTLGSSSAIEADIALSGTPERVLQAYGRPLTDLNGIRIGALIVLNDITRLRRLESMRRDFVANVSHELRTPITSIKGFVETLLNGALHNPDDALRFVEIISRQADRLNTIFDDLLNLSRIEEAKGEIDLEAGRVLEVVRHAVINCQRKADDKSIFLDTAGAADENALINPSLLEQAVVNLIDNAIKYSETGSVVRIEVHRLNDEVEISVIDSGCGIEEKHLARIFERFYRVDKARSRKIGGTGLGLSITKHISEAHGGYTTVKSVLGQGSTFTIHIKAAPGAEMPVRKIAANG